MHPVIPSLHDFTDKLTIPDSVISPEGGWGGRVTM
jgi:hypothetical protein